MLRKKKLKKKKKKSTFFLFGILSVDILYVRHFVYSKFCLSTFCLSTFCLHTALKGTQEQGGKGKSEEQWLRSSKNRQRRSDKELSQRCLAAVTSWIKTYFDRKISKMVRKTESRTSVCVQHNAFRQPWSSWITENNENIFQIFLKFL